MDGTGKYRTHGKDDLSHTAFVKDRSIAFDIGERLYRSRGYTPPWDDLPWNEVKDAHGAITLKQR